MMEDDEIDYHTWREGRRGGKEDRNWLLKWVKGAGGKTTDGRGNTALEYDGGMNKEGRCVMVFM